MYIDEIINLFFLNLGGLDFLAFSFGFVVMVSIIINLVKPLNV